MGRHQGARPGSRLVEVFILFALPFLLDWIVPISILINPPWTYSGIAVMLGGLVLASAARRMFLEVDTSVQLQGESHSLVTGGPFRFSRNPMYLGMLLWMVGLAILLGSLSAFFLPLVLFLVMNFVMIPMEEERMMEVCGDAYLDYKARVRRWLSIPRR